MNGILAQRCETYKFESGKFCQVRPTGVEDNHDQRVYQVSAVGQATKGNKSLPGQ